MKISDLLVGLTKYVDFEALAAGVDMAAQRPSRDKGGRPSYPTVLMVKGKRRPKVMLMPASNH